MKAEKECKEDNEFMEKWIQMEHQTFEDKLKKCEENHIQTKEKCNGNASPVKWNLWWTKF